MSESSIPRHVIDAILAVETAMLGRRPRVTDPVHIYSLDETLPVRAARPCSGAHRAVFLAGYLVVSCGKCHVTPRSEEGAE